ncbi:MAG: quinone-interacting membrane-bound oxidoreductase complex subunit QmoC [Candidatus Zixiibacteriota bacterium]
MAETRPLTPDPALIRDVKRLGGNTLKKCFQCGTCSSVCNLSSPSAPFPRKEMALAGWGQSERLVRDPNVWLCHQCNDCTTYCPRGARPGDVLAAIRAYAYKHFSFPSFMGRALATPRALPVLVFVPVVILLACVVWLAPQSVDGRYLFGTAAVIDFNLFLPHQYVDALFVIGNIMIFIFAAVGFRRFWKGMQRPGEKYELSFVGSLLKTIPEVLSHRKFRECDTNRPRTWGHLLLFYGFLGAMVTTGAIFVSIFAPHYLEQIGLQVLRPLFELPLNLPNPIKILGALSGVALALGGALLIIRRWGKKDEVGANGYTDYLFLYVIFLAGATGMAAWVARWAGTATIAYGSYFAHLVCVFFLLWYMPYSKFAHMIYRLLALAQARRLGYLDRRR